jgi:hypothetical protein
MPYITSPFRLHLDPVIDEITSRLREHFAWEVRHGATNYVISRIVAETLKPDAGWGYSSLSRAVAVLEDAAAEMRRRLLDPYEDAARERNGDLPEYEQKQEQP